MYVRPGYPDILYIVKPGDDNEELKYSLRSLKNLNHGRVFIAGHKPAWVGGLAEHIKTDQNGAKYDNVRKNWLTAINDPRLGEEFILMNDDFFIMRPTKNIPPLRRLKNIEHYIELFSKVDSTSYYVKTMRQTRELLRSWGITDISSYELHVPMLFNKKKLLELISKVPADYPATQLRTLYGNYFQIGGQRITDVKIINEDQNISFDNHFLSTLDGTFDAGKVGEFLRKKFAKVFVFSHAKDPDGLLSVILSQLAFAEVDYLLTNNPQADISSYLADHDVNKEYDYVLITDIYPGLPVLKQLPNAYWFDHKQNSLDKIQLHNLNMPNAHVTTDLDGRPTSGSELLYRWLCKQNLLSTEVGDFVEFIRKKDTWDFL